MGEKLPLRNVKPSGHAVEARVYAEDPERGFLPSTGRILALEFPDRNGIRIDTGVEVGAEVTPFYDPMIAKVIAHARSRAEALGMLASALDHTVVAGPRTNVAFLATLCRAAKFREGLFDTGFIDRNLHALGATAREADPAAAAKGLAHLLEREAARTASLSGDGASPWNLQDGFQLSGTRSVSIPISINGHPGSAAAWYGAHGLAVTVDGVAPSSSARVFGAEGTVYVIDHGHQTVVRMQDFEAIDVDHLDTGGLVVAPMHGKVLAILPQPGASVNKGERVAVIEAMKMEHALLAPVEGTVAEISAAAGDQIAEGAPVMNIEPKQSEPA